MIIIIQIRFVWQLIVNTLEILKKTCQQRDHHLFGCFVSHFNYLTLNIYYTNGKSMYCSLLHQEVRYELQNVFKYMM